MSTTELIAELTRTSPDELRQVLADKAKARNEVLSQFDREMELIERLIDVVEPKTKKSDCTRGGTVPERNNTPSATLPAENASTVATQARRIPAEKARIATVLDIKTFLEVMGPSAAGAIANQLKCDRNAVIDTLEHNQQFSTDSRGFWELRANAEARKEGGLQ